MWRLYVKQIRPWDFEERRANIRQHWLDLPAQGWQVPVDGDLLEEVTAIAPNGPTVFWRPEDKYLSVPIILYLDYWPCVITQRYFYA